MTTENIQAACIALAQSMLSPEQFGYAVTAEVRDAARVALGRAPVEQAQYLNVVPAIDEQAAWTAAYQKLTCGSIGTRELWDEAIRVGKSLSAAPAHHVSGVTEMVAEAKPVAADIRRNDAESMTAKELVERMRVDAAGGGAINVFMMDAAADMLERLAAAPQQPAPAVGADAVDLKDGERLDFLDGNLRWKMGWRVGKAPVGNVSVQSVGNSNVSIRTAIDAAIALQAGEQS